MTWLPIQGIVPQGTEAGNQAAGFVLKFYDVGTTTPKAVATDSTGGTTATDFLMDSEGYTSLNGNIVIPHVETTYKIALYLNQADADANDTGSAVYVIDNIGIANSSAASISYANGVSGRSATTVQAAIDEAFAELDTNTADIATNTAAIAKNTTNIAQSFIGIFNGLKASNGSTPTTDMDIASGTAADTTGVALMTIAATTTEIDGAIGTADGGFPSAITLAQNTTYHIFLVAEADGSNPRLGYDTSLTAANVLTDWSTIESPASYTIFKRIRSVKTATLTTDLVTEFQHGNRIYRDAPIEIATNKPTSLATLTCQTPLGIECEVVLQSLMAGTTGGSSAQTLRIKDLNAASEYGVARLFNPGGADQEVSHIVEFSVITSASSEMQFLYSDTDDLTASINQRYYIDPGL